MKRILTIVLLLAAAVCSHRAHSQQLWGTTMRGGADRGGTIFRTNADNSSFVEVMHEFTIDIKAANPIGPMVLANNNKFYGVSSHGGASDAGTIFEFDPATQAYTTRWEFTAPDILPAGGLMQASNGRLYGVCSVGGTSDKGVIYSFNIATGVFARVFSFTNSNAHGTSPSGQLIEGADGKLYGINGDGGGPGGIGVLYEFDLTTLLFTKLYTFTNAGGTHPSGGITMDAAGKLYGVTVSNGASNRGTFYSFDKTTNTFTRIHKFQNNDGARPSFSPITHSNGKIYGMAMGDRRSNAFGIDDGLIYEYDPAPAGTGFLIKDRFGDGSNEIGRASAGGLCEAANGKIYALTIDEGSNIIEFDPATGTATPLLINLPVWTGTRADNPFEVGPDGDLYITFIEGGATGLGSIVKYSPATNVAVKLLDMGSSSSGAYPYGDLVEAGGKLFGMVPVGGTHGVGSIFEIDPITGIYSKKFDFNGENGATPLGGMILASNGKLYGMTTFGGPSEEERTYHENPTRRIAGARGHGVLFEYDPATNTYLKKHDFAPGVGTNPYGKLMEATNGKLYGVTSMDGELGGGTLFEYVIDGAITKHHDFGPGVPGSTVRTNNGPKCQLVELDGKLYGTTPILGANNTGSLFEFDLENNTLTTKASFPAAGNTATVTGLNPEGGLVVHGGKLYGVASGGGINMNSGYGGTLYEYTPGASAVLRQLDFPNDAKMPVSKMAANGGRLYGTFTYSPNLNGGLFVYDPDTNMLTTKFQFDGINGASPQWGTLLVVSGKLRQTITFPQPETQEFAVTANSIPFIIVPTTSSVGLPVTYSSSNPAVAHTEVQGRVTQVGAGTTTITATQGGNDIYEAVTVERTVTILKGQQTITWPPPPTTPKLSLGTIALLATSSSGLPITYTSNNTEIATMEENVMNLKRAGNVTITATQLGNNNYLAAANISMPFAIQRGDQTITFSSIPAKEVSDGSFKLEATSTSQLIVSYTSSDPSVATIEGNTVTILAPGITNITASQAGDSNWNPAPTVVRPLIVNKMPQTITFDGPETKVLGTAPFEILATASSGLPVSFSTTSVGKITIEGSTVTVLRAGISSITASQAGNTAYNEAVPVTRTFCVNPAKPVITAALNNDGELVLSTLLTGALQWYLNDTPIPMATGPTHIANAPGGYTVFVNVQGCISEPSDVMQVIVTEVMSPKDPFSYYPNPVSDELHITIPNNSGSTVTIVGMEGRVMESIDTSENEVTVSVVDYPPGLYLLRVDGMVRRFVKK